MRIRAALLAMAFAVVSAAALAAGGADLEYRLGPGDRVKVTVFGHPDLSGELELDGEGRFSLPLVQTIDAAGLSLGELQQRVTEKLRPDYLRNPRVSAEVLNYRPFFIIGEVNTPGSYAYASGMTVIRAVALAGGFTYRAKQKKMLITRARDPERRKQAARQDTVVMPGDVIEVPERLF